MALDRTRTKRLLVQAALAHYRALLARQPTRSDVAAAIARLERRP